MVTRLEMLRVVWHTLRSTNPIEYAFDKARGFTRNGKRWQNGKQLLRRSAAELFEAEKEFQRINRYRELPMLTETFGKGSCQEKSVAAQIA